MTIESRDPCTFLTWDTEFWGVPTARGLGDTLTPERLQEIDAWAARQRISCLYFLARPDDAETTRLAEKSGFQFVDFRITFERPIKGAVNLAEARANLVAVVRSGRPDDIEALESMARTNHRDTRFYYDAHFLHHRCDALYATWMKRNCEGYADVVLVADIDDNPVGYISCHCDRETPTGTIGLVGVHPDARGRGIGMSLIGAALKWFAAHNRERVSVVTQGRNLAAQRMYQRMGFLTSDVHLWYHKWYIWERPSGD